MKDIWNYQYIRTFKVFNQLLFCIDEQALIFAVLIKGL